MKATLSLQKAFKAFSSAPLKQKIKTMELDGDSPPYWSQPSTTTLLRQRRRQPPSPPIINPVILILLLPILTILILFFLFPPFLSHTTQILRPNSVKKGWDSFNILLVVLAILCGVFARKNDENSADNSTVSTNQRNRIVSTSETSADDTRQSISNDQWFEHSVEKAYNFAPIGLQETGVNRLRRSSSSYPDLRRVPRWETGENHSRVFDDFGVNFYRSTAAAEYKSHRPRRSESQREESDIKVIPVDTFETRSSPREQSPSPEKPLVPSSKPPPANLKRRRSFHSVPRKDKVQMHSNEADVELNEKQEPSPPISLPLSPPLTEQPSPPVEKPQKLQRRKSGTKELATAIASLYNQSKKKKKRTKTRDIFESVSDSPPSAEPVLPPPTPPPPPPPPPPPTSKVFQNLFKKNRKSKRVHSDPSTAATAAPPPPPPPPPPNSIFNNLFKTGSKSKRFQQTSSSTPPLPPPPPPPPSSILNNLFKHGTKSRRFKSTPPPPPPPPPQEHVSSRRRKTSTHSQPPMQQPEPPRRRSSYSSKPPLPTRPVTSYYDDNLNNGSQSPLIPMPPPPPPPLFKMRETKFVPSSDFFRIRSEHSSRCSSPEIEDVDVDDVSVRSSSEAIDGEDLTGPSVTCPSPDVNAKADSFIARLRDEWRLEKMNSYREKRNLG